MARAARHERVKAAHRVLSEWTSALEMDTELSKPTADGGSETRTELLQLSEALRNLFRLLRQFSEEFGGAVHELLKPTNSGGGAGARRTSRHHRKQRKRDQSLPNRSLAASPMSSPVAAGRRSPSQILLTVTPCERDDADANE